MKKYLNIIRITGRIVFFAGMVAALAISLISGRDHPAWLPSLVTAWLGWAVWVLTAMWLKRV